MQLLDSTVALLRCPDCARPLARDGAATLTCTGGHRIAVRDGVPRFVADDDYAGNFSFEWQVHRRTQLDGDAARESEEIFRLNTGFTPAELRGKRVLDVGVGAGRFADIAARWGADVVGIDLSFAVETARENLSRYPTAQVLQADVFKLPFAPESFDYIFSIGVLHHTPDCRAAFARLPSLLKPGGRISIWVYSGYDDALRLNEAYRQLAQKLPRRLLYALSHLSIPYYYAFKVPLVGSALHHFFPRISLHPNLRWRVLDTYDWFSPKYQSHHTYPELYEWFRDAGLTDIAPLPMPVSMTGRRAAG